MSALQLPQKLEVFGVPSDLACLSGTYSLTEKQPTEACYTRDKHDGESTEDYFLYFCAEAGGGTGRWNMGDTKGSEIG